MAAVKERQKNFGQKNGGPEDGRRVAVVGALKSVLEVGIVWGFGGGGGFRGCEGELELPARVGVLGVV